MPKCPDRLLRDTQCVLELQRYLPPVFVSTFREKRCYVRRAVDHLDEKQLKAGNREKGQRTLSNIRLFRKTD
ncbi:hypothetical protein TNCT_106481 [Trichonephila clavata]|uniref:Uncharacterized protein n=1 Tax=Trichonephila clavata TaxID=2740835 RepID=A0A8X6L8U2_TRICU|nr:hypothetical protein TNCT_106481 [Trichonephila clavata]